MAPLRPLKNIKFKVSHHGTNGVQEQRAGVIEAIVKVTQHEQKAAHDRADLENKRKNK